jgi:hypothetical protein
LKGGLWWSLKCLESMDLKTKVISNISCLCHPHHPLTSAFLEWASWIHLDHPHFRMVPKLSPSVKSNVTLLILPCRWLFYHRDVDAKTRGRVLDPWKHPPPFCQGTPYGLDSWTPGKILRKILRKRLASAGQRALIGHVHWATPWVQGAMSCWRFFTGHLAPRKNNEGRPQSSGGSLILEDKCLRMP